MSKIDKPLENVSGRDTRNPSATYRLQFHQHFTFKQAAVLTKYLADLGITHCYASPLFKASPQSTHGYDICGFDQLNPELGAPEDFDKFSSSLRALGLGLIVDMVPNHMGTDASNRWWRSVLEFGRSSPYADFLDIDWESKSPDLKGKVLLPVLEASYSEVLESGKLQVLLENGEFAIGYHDRRFPIDPRTYPILLDALLAKLSKEDSGKGELADEFHRITAQLRTLSAQATADAEALTIFKARIQTAFENSAGVCDAVKIGLSRLNQGSGDALPFDWLHQLLTRQNYRLAFWRVGAEEINYRRFFDVTALVCLRMELESVFRASHQFVFELIRSGKISGVRIDHPDGLWNPREYFQRLQSRFLEFSESNANNGSLYVAVEKILSPGEELPVDWPVAGTTGYEFLNQTNGLFVQSENEGAFDRIYGEFIGSRGTFREAVRAGKIWVLKSSFLSELSQLTSSLREIAGASRYGQDFTLNQLRHALVEIIAAFPVYRTYLTENTKEPAPRDRDVIDKAILEAKERNPATDGAVFDFIRNILLFQVPQDLDAEARAASHRWVMKFQQLTGPVTAKGVEDTAFYNYNRLISLNEVGGDPGQFGISLAEFHRQNRLRSSQWPHSMLATATHDTKRGEDVRARINVLSEIPEDWEKALRRWSEQNAVKKTTVDGRRAPDANDEYLLYQTLLGAWPAPTDEVARAKGASTSPTAFDRKEFCERVSQYMIKACREAKRHTTWTEPNAAYESAVTSFVERILEETESNKPFLDEFCQLQRHVAFFGQFNSLAQVLLKITSPGLPDFYQGTELWDFSLVDPDNRRAVDYDLRQRLLEDLKTALGKKDVDPQSLPAQLLHEGHTGAMKLFVIERALNFRRRHSALFEKGEYLPIEVVGPHGKQVCAFARRFAQEIVVVVVPRLIVALTQNSIRAPIGQAIWQGTALDLGSDLGVGHFENVFTGERVTLEESKGSLRISIGSVLSIFPVALLYRVKESSSG